MHHVSPFRLLVLRALYLLIVVGLGTVVWPGVIHHDKPWELMEGFVACMLAAFSALSLFGLRYPLQMLPLLLWELLWKTLWLGVVALPQWWSGHIDEAIKPSIFACSLVVLVYIAMPWRYIVAQYVQKQGDRWSLFARAMPQQL